MATVVDYAAGPPSAAAIKQAGHIGAVRYISPPRESWMTGKPMQEAERLDFDAHGLKIAVCWQYGKDSGAAPPDVMRGWAGGVADAMAAQDELNRLGASGHPIFFCVDFDITLNEWNSTAVEYFRGAASIPGKQRVGIYGHSRCLAWAQEDDVVAEVEPGRILGWQTKSWSNGVVARGYAVLYQGVHNVPGPDGVQVDVNEVLHEDWGWRALPDSPAPSPAPRQSVDWSKINTTIKPNPHHRGDPHFLPDVLRAFGVTVEELPGWDT